MLAIISRHFFSANLLPSVLFSIASMSFNKPVKNLYARLGSKGPNFCFAGHLDVVPPGNLNDWTVNPFKPKVKNGHLVGRGANDMKSSIAAFVSAVSVFLNKNKKR